MNVAYAIPVQTEMIRQSEQARIKREQEIAASVVKEALPRQIRSKITTHRQRLADAQHAAARLNWS